MRRYQGYFRGVLIGLIVLMACGCSFRKVGVGLAKIVSGFGDIASAALPEKSEPSDED